MFCQRKHVEEFEKSYQFRKDVEPRLQQENADLFSSNKSLAHCVSEDMEMSAGIAKIFVRKFPDMKNDCWNQSVFVGWYFPELLITSLAGFLILNRRNLECCRSRRCGIFFSRRLSFHPFWSTILLAAIQRFH